MLVVPCVLLGLLAWIYDGTPVFDRIGPALLGVFPFVVMFIVTSVATLRERTSGTLERLLTTPMGKGDLMFGYALAFGAMAGGAGRGRLRVRHLRLRARHRRPGVGARGGRNGRGAGHGPGVARQWVRPDRVPGRAVHAGLRAAAVLLCGLLVVRDQLPAVLQPISDVLPLSYAVDAMNAVAAQPEPLAEVLPDVAVIAAWIAASLLLGSLTLRRRTPSGRRLALSAAVTRTADVGRLL